MSSEGTSQRRAKEEDSLPSASEPTDGESIGYQARLQGYETRGEVQTIEGSWARSLAGEGLVHEDLDQMPVWMGIATTPSHRRTAVVDSESSHSCGSFEFLNE